MEIMSAVAESGDRRLQAKFKHSLNVVDRTLALYRFEEVAFSFNGGKDSTVLLHLLRAGFAAGASRSCSESADPKSPSSATPHSITTIYFRSPNAFPEIDAFTLETAKRYNLELKEISLDFKSGIEELRRDRPIMAIFLGTRIGDPNAVGQEKFSPSSAGWPPFMRVNPILDWSYRDVWAFLLACKVPYCKLYDQGYTSIGSVHDTSPNGALLISRLDGQVEMGDAPGSAIYRPAYLLRDGRLERAGRTKKPSSKCHSTVDATDNGDLSVARGNTLYAASILVVGDEILRGEVEDLVGTYLSQELHLIGWAIARRAILPNDIDAISEEVEQRSATNDLVLIAGGVGPLHSDVTLAGVAKAFGVRLATDEEFEEDLRQQIGEHCSGDQNKMAKLPEGITELLPHKDLPVPVIKCRNVYVLPAATRAEVEVQWRCLLELSSERDLFRIQGPFASIRLCTAVPEVEIAGPLSQLDSEYPDLTIGCYRESARSEAVKGNWNVGRLVLSIIGKSATRVTSAAKALEAVFSPGDVVELRDE